MKEILIKTLEAYQESVDKAEEYKNPNDYYKYLVKECLQNGICYFIIMKYTEKEMNKFMNLLVEKSIIPENRIKLEFYCNPPYYYLLDIEHCIEKALKPRIELLTKMINDYENIN